MSLNYTYLLTPDEQRMVVLAVFRFLLSHIFTVLSSLPLITVFSSSPKQAEVTSLFIYVVRINTGHLVTRFDNCRNNIAIYGTYSV